TLNIVVGQSGMATFTVTPENGFYSQVSFACKGLPSETFCDFDPPNVTPNGAPANTTVTVKTTPRSATMRMITPTSQLPACALVLSALAKMLGVAGRRRRVLRGMCLLGLLAFLAGASMLSSCSGGGGGNPGTPVGMTKASVSAAAGGVGGPN